MSVTPLGPHWGWGRAWSHVQSPGPPKSQGRWNCSFALCQLPPVPACPSGSGKAPVSRNKVSRLLAALVHVPRHSDICTRKPGWVLLRTAVQLSKALQPSEVHSENNQVACPAPDVLRRGTPARGPPCYFLIGLFLSATLDRSTEESAPNVYTCLLGDNTKLIFISFSVCSSTVSKSSTMNIYFFQFKRQMR